MKFGQALSVFEAALPEELAGPYRQALTKLQEAAPPLPAATVHKVLADRARAPTGATSSCDFDDVPGRRGEHRPGAPRGLEDPREGRRRVAVKIQYPGAGQALLADLTQLSRLARLFRVVQPGLDVKPLLAELRARITEELDYELEATGAARVRQGVRG